jgi:hypothetical protein
MVMPPSGAGRAVNRMRPPSAVNLLAGEKIEQKLLDAFGIDQDFRQIRFGPHFEHLLFQFEGLGHRVASGFQDFAGKTGLPGEGHAAAFQLGNVEHIGDDFEQPPPRPGNMVGIFRGLLRGRGAGLADDVGKTDDRIQGGPQFVTHRPEKG